MLYIQYVIAIGQLLQRTDQCIENVNPCEPWHTIWLQ